MNNSEGISYNLFLKNILEIKNLSDELEDGWTLEGKLHEDYNSYLKKKIIKNDDCSLSTTKHCDILKKCRTVEYHVVYNVSYQVPVLCINIWNFDGKKLTMEEIWRYFNGTYSQENMYSVVTEQDHPVLQKPFMIFHPCKTIEVLDNLAISKNPVISWLSAIGPTVNLYFSNEYEKLTRVSN